MGAEPNPKEVALVFLKKYATENQFFTGGDVLAAFRESGDPAAQIDWRNKWGGVMNLGSKNLWYHKVGRAKPTSKQSHTGTLVLWKSRLYTGPDFGGPNAATQIEAIRKQVYLRECNLVEGLWKAYTLGCEINQR